MINEFLLNYFQTEQAHMSTQKAVENLKTEFRYKRPVDHMSTIWEELEHIRLAQEDILKYMFEPGWQSPPWPAGYWPERKEVITEEDWQNTLDNFSADIKQICGSLSEKNFDLTKSIPHAPQHTYLRELMIILDHNAYHTGKIIMLRKYFNEWPG